MPKKYVVSILAIIMTLSIALAAGLNDSQENRSLTSPKASQADQTAWDKSGSRAVVWDNGMNYTGLLSAQQESDPTGLDTEPADDFLFSVDQLVNDVHWIGGYWSGPPDDGNFDWTVRFYSDDGSGTKPGALIATYVFTNAEVNETWIAGNPGDVNYYSYSVVLPGPALSFLAGTKYWISIQGQGDTSPQSGWAYHEDPDILLHEAVIRSVYFGLPNWTDLSAALGAAGDMCFQLTYEEGCSWNLGDDHKMHYPQLPDEAGWDVDATEPLVLADDFMCMETGLIKDIHFWGSWKNDIEGEVLAFVLSLHEDIPADQNPAGYSMPGITLWEYWAEDFDIVGIDPPTMEGWYDPANGEVLWNNHQHYFQYNVCLPEGWWFPQDSGTIYWLNITAIVADPDGTRWGWKSTQDHWNDDAVWAFWGELNWIDMWEPAQPLVNWANIAIGPMGEFLGGGGDDPYGDGWYYYPQYEWWNIWFYDHPFDSTRRKIGHIEFDVFPVSYSAPMWVEVAVNWSTDLWEGTGPPLPGEDEDLFIGRQILFSSDWAEGNYGPFPYWILDYNPEWVSIDVRGYNFDLPGIIIEHECQGSLDLAFVITGGEDMPVEACCMTDGTCQMLSVDECINLGGVPQGAGSQCTAPEACCLPGAAGGCITVDPLCCITVFGGIPQGAGTACTAPEACCLADGSCVMEDPLCCLNILGGNPQGPGSSCSAAPEACCFPDGTCQMLDPLCCMDQGGQPQGPGTTCLGIQACCLADGSCVMMDALCCANILGGTPQGVGTSCSPNTIACCLPDNTCVDVDPLCCDDLGGTPSPIGATSCMGDGNGNGVDDACEEEEICDCIPGDANNDGEVNIGDAVYIIAYVFKGGPPPAPYLLCSGDANCDCELNIGDAVYIIAYVFKGGPPPCTCEEWLAICGPPLRK
jgi:hypothetical protein